MRFWAALEFLTIIPSPIRREFKEGEIGSSSGYFPLVGLGLGLILFGLDRLLGLAMPVSVVNILLIIALVILTGALHLDGFIDTCDGFIARRSTEERLRAMSDSRVGAFGVIGACCIILLKYLSLASVPVDLRMAALILMPVLSRWAMVYSLFAFPYAKGSSGTGYIFKQQTNWRKMTMATLIALAPSLILMGWRGAALMAGLWVITLGIASYLRHRLGGHTGDTYGAINEVAEVVTLILLPLIAGV